MAILRDAVPKSGTRALCASVDVQSSAQAAFELMCAVDKWPVWLSFLRSATLAGRPAPIGLGSEVLLRCAIPGEPEQLFEVDHFISNHQLSLVGAYSVRRRLDFRIEQKSSRCKVSIRLEYPAYGGKLAMLYDGVLAGRKLAMQLDESVIAFKHLAEYNPKPKDELLADF